MIVLSFLLAVSATAHLLDQNTCPGGNSRRLPLPLPKQWNADSIKCCDEKLQQQHVNTFAVFNDTFILREYSSVNEEASLAYLLIGDLTAVLIDSESELSLAIQETAERLIENWCKSHQRRRENLNFLITRTQFDQDPLADQARESFSSVLWPNPIGRYVLGGDRHLLIIPLSQRGSSPVTVAFYDCSTGLLIANSVEQTSNGESIENLMKFLESNRLSVTSMNQERLMQHPAPVHSSYHSNELQSQSPVVKFDRQSSMVSGASDRFVSDTQSDVPKLIQQVPLPADQRVAVHGFILMPLANPNDVWISHKPMFQTPHDFQLTFLAKITNSTLNPIPLPTNLTLLSNQWTIEPDQWSLNNFINGDIKSFRVKLYRGNFERDGVYLCNLTVHVTRPLLTIVPLNASERQRPEPLSYMSYPLSNQSVKNRSEIHFYLLHQIRSPPDFDAIAHAILDPKNCVTRLGANQLIDLLQKDGNIWTFRNLSNNIQSRLTRASATVRAELRDELNSTLCTMNIVEEIQCTVGPDFYDDCPSVSKCHLLTSTRHHHLMILISLVFTLRFFLC